MAAFVQSSDYAIVIVKQHSTSSLLVNLTLKSLTWVSLHFKISTLKKYLAISRSVFLHNIYVQLHLYKENNVLLKTVARSDSSLARIRHDFTQKQTTWMRQRKVHSTRLSCTDTDTNLTDKSYSYFLFIMRCVRNGNFLSCAANRNVVHMKTRCLMLHYSTGQGQKTE